jgi:hypothetical protein
MGSPLVGGSATSTVAKRFIKVQRAFHFGGRVLGVGEVVEVPAGFASEMIHATKAIACEAPVAVVETVAEAPVIEAEKPRRGRPPRSVSND